MMEMWVLHQLLKQKRVHVNIFATDGGTSSFSVLCWATVGHHVLTVSMSSLHKRTRRNDKTQFRSVGIKKYRYVTANLAAPADRKC